MFNPSDFLKVPPFAVTPAASMAITAFRTVGDDYLQRDIQFDHMGHVRECLDRLSSQKLMGGFVITEAGSLRVVDSILPDDYQRRVVICMDSEVEDVRIRMFRASGLIGKEQ